MSRERERDAHTQSREDKGLEGLRGEERKESRLSSASSALRGLGESHGDVTQVEVALQKKVAQPVPAFCKLVHC